MSTNGRNSNPAVTLFAFGIPCLLASLLVYSQRHLMAASLFGARFLFGVPLTGDDSLKLLFVGFGSMVGILMSLALIVAGVIAFARSSQVRSGSEPAATLPTHR